MVEINYASGEISLKIVFYGPGLSGKTTNLEVIHQKAPETHKGQLTSVATQQDRTLFFDFMPLDLGRIGGLKTKLRLFTVPGQPFYNATRKLVLKRVDGLVFVADSQRDKMPENIDSLNNLKENLAAHNINIDETPLVLQYNKRDLDNIFTVEELDNTLNPDRKLKSFEAVAITGEGVFPTLKSIAALVLKTVDKMFQSSSTQPKKLGKFSKKK
ncbi:ATP/GTP-binding protein [Candidatus Uabimicrobium sp. HlEnr_7]|uniref:GTP-binding protein n=1 Tax=Candidatus Uabimicrobium helgolandensis TaxID=3095367 RepID=UPI0035569E3E